MVFDNNLASREDIKECESKLLDSFVKAGLRKAEKEKDPSFLRKVSLFLYDKFGTNGYSEIPGLTIKGFFEKIKSIFVK